ncbi:MAG: phosphotyrosine protein phosphatase [Proteobacteria bacterium]|nr:phosphotyrosine protein phosphatase [Pseudomonadota bacterium]
MAHRILFVCMGNICRSPTAEAVFREIARREGQDLLVEVDSAGTHAYHVGEPPDSRAIIAARRRGIAMEHLRARLVARDDFLRFDYLLAMDEQNLEHLRRLAPAGHRAELRLFLDYAPGAGQRDVPDPYYGGETGFEQVLDLVEEASRGLIAALRK